MDLVLWATDTGIPKLIEAGQWLKDRWDTNFLGIQTTIKAVVAAIKLAFDGWIQAIDLMIAAWDRAVKAYENFKKTVSGGVPRSPESINPLNPALPGDVIGAGEKISMARGGLVPAYARTGAVFSSRGTDTIPAMVSPGELILNRAQQENLAKQMNGQGFVFNMYNPNFRDEGNANSIVQEIIRLIQKANLGVA